MNEFITDVIKSVPNQVFWIIVGICITAFIDKTANIAKDKIKRFKATKKTDIVDKEYLSKNNIVGLAHAYPYYLDKNVQLKNTEKALYLKCPEPFRSEILSENPRFEFREDMSFNGSNSFEELKHITGIDDLVSLIEKHKIIVAKQFLNKLKRNEEIFNGKKFGVYSITTDKEGDEKKEILDIKLFETDYYTHQVFRSIYKQLSERNDPIVNVTKINELFRYRPFTTSLGVNTYVIVDNADLEGKKLVFAKRSKYLGIGDRDSRWHVSMNEGLSKTDIDFGKVSLHKCLLRGLNEELGIRNINSINRNIKFMDIFLDKNYFELGVTSFVELNMSFDNLYLLYMSAKDSKLETDEIISIKLKKKYIEKFISENKGNFTDAGLYTLAMLKNRFDFFV